MWGSNLSVQVSTRGGVVKEFRVSLSHTGTGSSTTTACFGANIPTFWLHVFGTWYRWCSGVTPPSLLPRAEKIKGGARREEERERKEQREEDV